MSDAHQLDPESLGDHVDRLYRAAWSLCGSRHDAEDLVQETFAHVLRRPRLIRSDDDIGYLLRAMRNTYIAGRRRSARRPAEVPLPDDLELVADPAATQPEHLLVTAELYSAISALPAELRDTMIAIDVVGLSYNEASRALRVREKTIATRLHRARKRLASQLTR